MVYGNLEMKYIIMDVSTVFELLRESFSSYSEQIMSIQRVYFHPDDSGQAFLTSEPLVITTWSAYCKNAIYVTVPSSLVQSK